MRVPTTLIIFVTARLAIALPQSIDFVAVNAIPQPAALGAPIAGLQDVPSYSPSDAARSAASAATASPVAITARKRSVDGIPDCAPQPAGSAPTTIPDTSDDFVANSNYTDIALAAEDPQGYQQVFQNLNGATQQDGYLGYYTLNSYNTIKCQEYCDSVISCTAFNIYIERQPTQWPAEGCSNPSSTATYKCSLYGLPICNDTATNFGQYMEQFHVVIAGSNGYVKNSPPPSYSNFTSPSALGGAIQAPSGDTSYIGMRLYPGPYDPGQCAATCQATTEYDSQHLVRPDGSYDPCNFFNSFVLSLNNVPQGTYCMFFTRPWGFNYGTNIGQYDNQGNYYSVSSSYAYTLDPQDPGVVANTTQ